MGDGTSTVQSRNHLGKIFNNDVVVTEDKKVSEDNKEAEDHYELFYQDVNDLKKRIEFESDSMLNGEPVFLNNNEKYGQFVETEEQLKRRMKSIRSLISGNIAQSAPNASADSLHDFFGEVRDSITAGKNNYLDILKDLFSKYMDFVKQVREIISLLSQAAKAGSKDGYISIDTDELYSKLQSLYANTHLHGSFEPSFKFTRASDGGYYQEINGEKIYYKDKDAMYSAMDAIQKLLNEIKGIEFIKHSSGNDTIYFSFKINWDFTGLLNLIDTLNKLPDGRHDILQTEFDLIKRSLDTYEKEINNNLDELSKKYSAANSNYDNFVKIVSSTMTTLLEMAKGFLRF